jgi:hypothetical protein
MEETILLVLVLPKIYSRIASHLFYRDGKNFSLVEYASGLDN